MTTEPAKEETATEEPDISKMYLCLHCGGIIEFSLPPKERVKDYVDKGVGLKPQWRHIATTNVPCMTVAAPSNIEFPASEF